MFIRSFAIFFPFILSTAFASAQAAKPSSDLAEKAPHGHREALKTPRNCPREFAHGWSAPNSTVRTSLLSLGGAMRSAYMGTLRDASLNLAIGQWAESGIKITSAGSSDNPRGCPQALFFKLSDAETRVALGTVPIPADADGSVLDARVRQMLLTPKADLAALERAHEHFERDRAYFLAQYGIEVGDQARGPGKSQNAEEAVLRPTAKSCGEPGDETKDGPEASSLGLELKVKFIEYVPGRARYDADSIYQPGDLFIALLGNAAAYAAMLDRATLNAKNCESADGKFWSSAVARLSRDHLL
jgi:hypothetical protein